MFYLGKALQLSGMITLVWAFVVGFWGNNMYRELSLLGLGAGVFVLGSLLLKRGRPA